MGEYFYKNKVKEFKKMDDMEIKLEFDESSV